MIPTPGITQGLLLDTITRTGSETADQGCSPIPADIVVTVITRPTEAIPGDIIETVDATIGVLCNAITPVLIITIMTHHIKDHHHIGVLQLIPKISSRSQSHSASKSSKKTLYKSSSHPSRTSVKPQNRRHPRVTIDDPQTDYYSTDTSSDSEDDEGHLN